MVCVILVCLLETGIASVDGKCLTNYQEND